MLPTLVHGKGKFKKGGVMVLTGACSYITFSVVSDEVSSEWTLTLTFHGGNVKCCPLSG